MRVLAGLGRASALLLAAVMLLTVAPALQASGQHQGGAVVMGFLPYWEVDSYTPSQLPVTDLVFFNAPVQADGTLDTGRLERSAQALERIRGECGCRIHLAVTMFNRDLADSVLAYHRVELANSIRSVAIQYGFDGVNLDFEFMRDKNSITGEDNTDLLIDLIQRIRQGTNLIISIDVSGSVEQVYRDGRLSSYVDYVFLMGYDYHYSGSPETGSVSPLQGPGLSIEWSIDKLLDYYPGNKIILGLPLYGYDWPSQTCDKGSQTTGRGVARTLSYIENNILPGGEPHWDGESASPWITYSSGSRCHQVWYENATSLAIKADYALSRGLAGFGFWALGYAEGSPSGPLVGDLARSRSVEPGVDRVIVRVEGSRLIIRLEGARALSGLVIRVHAPGAGAESASPGDFPLRSLEVESSGGDIVIAAWAEEPLPGSGIWGNGTLAVVNLSGPASVDSASASGYALRLTPSRDTRAVPAAVGSVTVESGGGGGGGGGGSSGGGRGGVVGEVPGAPVSGPEPPRRSVSWIALAAVAAAIIILAALALARVLF